jgi:hypothetical protein
MHKATVLDQTNPKCSGTCSLNTPSNAPLQVSSLTIALNSLYALRIVDSVLSSKRQRRYRTHSSRSHNKRMDCRPSHGSCPCRHRRYSARFAAQRRSPHSAVFAVSADVVPGRKKQALELVAQVFDSRKNAVLTSEVARRKWRVVRWAEPRRRWARRGASAQQTVCLQYFLS